MFWFILGLALLFLILALVFIPLGRRHKKPWWTVAGVLFLFLGLVDLSLAGPAWTRQTLERFVALATSGKFEELNRYLPESAKWQAAPDGSLTIRPENGSAITFAPTSLPLQLFETHPIESRKSSLWEGHNSFVLAPRGRLTHRIHCTSNHGTVHCDRIETVNEIK